MHFARVLHEETKTSTYSVLYPNTMEFLSQEEALLVPLLDFHCELILLPKVDVDATGLSSTCVNRCAAITAYEHALLDMGGMHDLIFYNGMSQLMASLVSHMEAGQV